MTKLSELEDNLEALEDADDMIDDIGSQDGDQNLEDDVFNQMFEYAEQSIRGEGGDPEYRILGRQAFSQDRFEFHDIEGLPGIENIHEYRRSMIEAAFGDLFDDDEQSRLVDSIEWRDIYASLKLQASYSGESYKQRLRGYLRYASTAVRHYIKSRPDLVQTLKRTTSIIPSEYLDKSQDMTVDGGEDPQHLSVQSKIEVETNE
jgi:hypothetical protein